MSWLIPWYVIMTFSLFYLKSMWIQNLCMQIFHVPHGMLRHLQSSIWIGKNSFSILGVMVYGNVAWFGFEWYWLPVGYGLDDMGFGCSIWYWKCRLTKRKSTIILPPPPLPFPHRGINPFGIPAFPVPAPMGISPFGLPWNPAIGPPANIFIG